LLFWIGPGWPMLNSQHYQPTLDTFKRNFKSIVEFSTMLREARINVYSVGVGQYHVMAAGSMQATASAWSRTSLTSMSLNPAGCFNGACDDVNRTSNDNPENDNEIGADEAATGGPGMGTYKGIPINTAVFVEPPDYYNPLDYLANLKGVKQYWRANAASLAVQVLAIQNGGRALGLDNGLASQIDSSLQDARAFYTISFNPPPAAQPNEYHDVKVLVESDGPKLTAHTSTGYYNQP
jgi:hypothetical protein